MDFLKPENFLRYGYKDCILCEVERKGEEKRCRRCSGRVDQRDRLLWEINRARILRKSSTLSLVYPGLGHIYSGRYAEGIFWASLIPLSIGLVLGIWQKPTIGHAVLLLEFGLIYYLARISAGRGFREIPAPCQAACPSDLNVPDYIALVREGHILESLALVHDRLPFAAFCGRACPHPCEQKCVRNEFNAPISIMAIKRYLADLGYAAGITPSSGEGDAGDLLKVAVVGAGPAGLSAADTLARLGCRVTVFDSNEKPGGMMTHAAAEFRFPKEAADEDIKTIFDRGVHFEGGKRLGRDFTIADIEKQAYHAVLIAVGTGEAIRLPGEGTEKEGFYEGLTYLSLARRGTPILTDGRLVVIGGGNAAMDVARVAVRLGTQDVTVACLESRDAMPAHPWEVEDAIAEGIRILPSTAVRKFIIRRGKVEGLEAISVEKLEFDAKGRIVPHTVPGSEFDVRADMVVMAIGSKADLDFLPAAASREAINAAHHVYRLHFKAGEINIPSYIFGDCVRGPGSVVEASASGRAAALNIFEQLRVQEVRKARFEDNYRRAFEPQVTDRPEWRIRRKALRLSPEESKRTFNEVEKRFTEESVHHEAERCARCNLWL